jgi:hypothetical protein
VVKELHVEDPHEKEVAWEDKVDAYYEMAYEGLELPEKLHELHVEQFGHYSGDRDPAMVRAEKQWDSYMLAVDVEDERSPRERLNMYFGQ